MPPFFDSTLCISSCSNLRTSTSKRSCADFLVQVMSLSLSFSLFIKLLELIVALAPFSKLYDGVGEVARDVIGSYLLLSVVVVETVWSLYTFMSKFSLAQCCSVLLIKMCGSFLFPFTRWDPFRHTFSSPAACGPCLTNCNRTG